MTSGDTVHPVVRGRRRSEGGGGGKGEVSFLQDFGAYQICLLAATQLSYMPVAATILATTFMKTSSEACKEILASRVQQTSSNDTTVEETAGLADPPPLWDDDFHSLIRHWQLDCTDEGQRLQTVISTVIMVGGLLGSFLCGFLADRYGRKPVVIASLVLLSLSNALLVAVGALLPAAARLAILPLWVVQGAACGGYMTTNLVLVVESLCLPSSRLLVVALNGWSLSMAGAALLAFMCPHWLQYHLSIVVLSAVAAAVLHGVADESVRWLKSSGRVGRFDRASKRLMRFNGRRSLSEVALLCQLERDEGVSAAGAVGAAGAATSAAAATRPLIGRGKEVEEEERGSAESGMASDLLPAPSLSYLDLFAEKRLRTRLLALGYCFFCSSVVSFGFYFAFDSLSGNRYANLAIGGSSKFLLGLLPFLVSSCVSRKQVALISLACAAIAAWVVLGCLIAGLAFRSIIITVLSLVALAALDPTWKISHLYSTELFPTPVRNMARGFCNSAARIGSVMAPLAVHLRHDLPHAYFGMFAALLTVQLVVTALYLPNEPDMDERLHAPPTAAAAAAGIEEEESRSRESSSQGSETAPLTP